MKNNKEKIVLILKIIIVAILVVILSSLTIQYNWFGINDFTYNIKTKFPNECREHGGTYVAKGFGICYDYDEDGYKFYWKTDENGRWYKEK